MNSTDPTTSTRLSADTLARLASAGYRIEDLGSYSVAVRAGEIVTFEEEATQVLAPKTVKVEDDGWDAIEIDDTPDWSGWTVKELRAELLATGAASDLSETGDYGVAVRGNAVIRKMRRAELIETLNEWR